MCASIDFTTELGFKQHNIFLVLQIKRKICGSHSHFLHTHKYYVGNNTHMECKENKNKFSDTGTFFFFIIRFKSCYYCYNNSQMHSMRFFLCFNIIIVIIRDTHMEFVTFL